MDERVSQLIKQLTQGGSGRRVLCQSMGDYFQKVAKPMYELGLHRKGGMSRETVSCKEYLIDTWMLPDGSTIEASYPRPEYASIADIERVIGDIERHLDALKKRLGPDPRPTWHLYPLHQIVATGVAGLVRGFLEDKPNVNERSEPSGLTALHVNVSGLLRDDDDRQEIIKLLHAAGADLEARSHDKGLTPLQLAAIRGKSRAVATLIELGANVNATERAGATALHGAAFHGYKEVVTVLLAAGADPTLRDHQGGSPLSLAKARGHVEIAELLEAGSGSRQHSWWKKLR
jgi:Ankyrin repeats (3 copies)